MPQVNPSTVLIMILDRLDSALPEEGPEILNPWEPEPAVDSETGELSTVQLVAVRHTPVPTNSAAGNTAIDEIEVQLQIRTSQGSHNSSAQAIHTAVAQVREALSDKHLTNALGKHAVWMHKFNVEIDSYGDQTARAIGMATLTGRGQAQAYP